MVIKEIDRQLDTMGRETKKLIREGVDKSGLMIGMSSALAEMAGSNLHYAGYIVSEGKKRIANIAAY